MVISSSNRSPSPMSTRPNPNPNPNPNSRSQQELRKSFSGYPLGNGKPSIVSQPRSFVPNTPANSPAEFAKRASFGRDHEQKENERDLANLKPIARPRSPSVSKGSKNFMSPTISAASKVNPSPRKKVLGERNEAIRTSASLSDGKFQFFSTMSSLEFSHENELKGESENRGNNVTECSPGERKIESEPDLVVLSPEIPVKNDVESNVGLDVKNTTCSSPSIIAPLGADPSFPPYDPKTNFLSPRPQFLCYRPNPRIESYINQGLRLEDQFASETSSETESSEETQSQNSSKEQEDSFSSSSCYSEGVSPLEEQPPSFESNPTETQKTEEATETKTEPRPRFFTKWKTLAFVLVFLLGFVAFSVTYNPSFGNAMFRDEVIAKVYNDPHVVVDLAKANFNGVVQRATLWSAHSVGHLSQMIHNWREVNTFSPVLFSNLTGWQEEEDYLVGDFELGSFFERKDDVGYVVGDFELSYFVEKEEGQERTIDTIAENFAATEELELFVEETNLAVLDDFKPEKVEENSVLPFIGHENSLIEAEVPKAEMQSNPDTEEQEPEEVEEKYALLPLDNGGNSMIEEETEISADLQGEFQIEDNSEGPSSHGPEIPPQILTTSELLADDDLSSSINIETEDMIDEVETNSEIVLEATPRNSELLELSEISSTPSITAVSVVALSLMTVAAAFMYLKPNKNTSVISAPLAADQLEKKEKSVIEKSVASVKEPSIYECQPSWSGPVEVDNMMSEPCPSEMSSFQKTSSHSKRGGGRKGTDEAQSQSLERMPKRDSNKRESLASSSSEYTMCSSYGSFTTYSIVPSKKGDEEVVTPVRRSSRIRSKVTSP